MAGNHQNLAHAIWLRGLYISRQISLNTVSGRFLVVHTCAAIDEQVVIFDKTHRSAFGGVRMVE